MFSGIGVNVVVGLVNFGYMGYLIFVLLDNVVGDVVVFYFKKLGIL